MEKIKTFFICLFTMMLTFIGSLAGQDNRDAYRTEVFSAGSSPSVEINTSGGSIRVNGHNDDEVIVEMIVRRGNRTLSPSDTDLEDYDIEIHQNGNNVLASARKKSNGNWSGSGPGLSISFVVHTPETSVVNGNTSGGSVSAKNLSASLSLRTSGGSVRAESIYADTDLRTSGGSITIKDVHGTINARTSGGSITAETMTGPANLRTSGGSVRIEDSRGAISARTSGGSIRAHLAEFNNDLDLRTSGGSIRIEMPDTENFALDLSGNRVNVDLKNFTGRSERDRVSGTIGNGGPKISARTSAGSVTLNYN